MSDKFLKDNYKIDMILKSINLDHLIHNFSKKGTTLDTFFNLTADDLDYLEINDEKERETILKEILPYKYYYKDTIENTELNYKILLTHTQKQLSMIASLLPFLKNNLKKSRRENSLIDDSHSVGSAIKEFTSESLRQLDYLEKDILSVLRGEKQESKVGRIVIGVCLGVSIPFLGFLFIKQLSSYKSIA